MIDAFKRASAGRITAVVPYYAYGRSDKKDQPRVPITARLIADMISVAGADRLLTMDLHQGQIQGFFNIPVDELTAVHLLSNYFSQKQLEDLVVVTDLGFAKRARTFAELLDAPLAIIEKRRVGNLDRAELLNVIGEVRGRRAIVVDDEIDTGSTLMEVVRALEREGVEEIYACATHGVLSDPAIDRIRESNLAEVVITDTIPLPPPSTCRASRCCPSRRSSARPSAASTAASRSVRSSRARSTSSRRCSSGTTMTGRPPDHVAGSSTGRPAMASNRAPASRSATDEPQALSPGPGGLEPNPVQDKDWRRRLRSRRWNPAPLEKTDAADRRHPVLRRPGAADPRHPARRATASGFWG